MGVLKGFLYFSAAVFVLLGLLPGYFFDLGFFTALILAAGLALAGLTFRAARRFEVRRGDEQRAQLEQTYRRLAGTSGGRVGLGALARATGQAPEAVRTQMQQLVGRGLCELDFSDDGELEYRRTPMDEARASLAAAVSPRRERTR